MNSELLSKLARDSGFFANPEVEKFQKFAELIVKECINTLEFHGFDDAVPYVKWMATNKLGVEENEQSKN